MATVDRRDFLRLAGIFGTSLFLAPLSGSAGNGESLRNSYRSLELPKILGSGGIFLPRMIQKRPHEGYPNYFSVNSDFPIILDEGQTQIGIGDFMITGKATNGETLGIGDLARFYWNAEYVLVDKNSSRQYRLTKKLEQISNPPEHMRADPLDSARYILLNTPQAFQFETGHIYILEIHKLNKRAVMSEFTTIIQR